jgi:O-antigen ligase
LATYLKTDRQLQAVAFSMGLGLLITLVISTRGFHTYYGFDVRSAGAFTNANYFGSVAVTVFFLNLAVWVKAGNSPKSRILSGCLILVSLTGCLVSGSRGALFGLVAGLLVMLRYTAGPCRRIRNAAALVVLIMLAILLVPAGYAETLQARVSIERLVEDNAAGRLSVWAAYIVRMSRYVLTGLGYGRSLTLTVGVLPQPRSTHNHYLAVLVDLGVMGLLLFVLGLWQVWRALRYPSRQIGDWRIDAVYRGFFVAWLFLLSTGTRGTSRAWWLSLGVIVAYGRAKRMLVGRRQLGDGVDIENDS